MAVFRGILDAYQELVSTTRRCSRALNISRDQAVAEVKTTVDRDRVGIAKTLHRIRLGPDQHMPTIQGANYDPDLQIAVVDVV